MKTDREFWRWLWEDEEVPPPPPTREAPATATAVEDHVDLEDGPGPEQESGGPPAPAPAPPVPDRRRTSSRRGKGLRWVALAAVVAVAGGVVAAVIVPRVGGPAGEKPEPPAAGFGGQLVVVWTLWDDVPAGHPFVAVLGVGGGKEPVSVAVPGNTEVDVPGYGNLAVLEEVAASGDLATVTATVENILGVRIDEAWGIQIQRIRPLVEAAGGIDAGFKHLGADGVIEYLRGSPPVERAIRWQEVLAGLTEALGGAALPGVPAAVRPAFTAGAGTAVILPTEDIGAGLARPVPTEVAELVAERFVPTGSEEKVRLVVLNGNGSPGIGQAVARRLVPEGFQIVASQNLDTFDQEQTSIVATSRDYLRAAHTARRLLGVGRVVIGEQPTYVADVFVIVGKDFDPPDAGGP